MPQAKREFWRLDAEHGNDDDLRSQTRFFVSQALALEYGKLLTQQGFYCDVYRVKLTVPAAIAKVLFDGIWPNFQEELLIELARNPVAKAEADLDRVLKTRRAAAS